MTPAATTRIRPRGAARPARRPSGRSVRVRTVLIGAAVVAAVLGLIAVAWLSPLLSVRTVEVVGATAIPQEDVLVRLDLAEGTPLLQVDTAAAAQRVAALPRAASVRVQRVYPSTVRVTVTEREVVVFVDAPDGTHSLDADGVDFAVEPPPMLTPRLVTPAAGPGDPATAAAIEVLEALPPELRVQVGEVNAPSASEISLTLHDGRIVVWGTVERSDRKAQVVVPLLTRPGQTYDVAAPDLPTVR
ncbi:cell division protein FtsQ/DivIB [Rhodococcus rhodochrous]|uniref:cell division protein FtsQ/DivIB n=1 Tax=Rhodococcus rhodochrous TaxID=1829 RepID=UPI0009BF23D5|nr:FtsQ-type POTRA domain-containing protein [Rhodococcus rhodochrous]